MVFKVPSPTTANVSVGDGITVKVEKQIAKLPANLNLKVVKHLLDMGWIPKDDEAGNAAALAGLDKLAQAALVEKDRKAEADKLQESTAQAGGASSSAAK